MRPQLTVGEGGSFFSQINDFERRTGDTVVFGSPDTFDKIPRAKPAVDAPPQQYISGK